MGAGARSFLLFSFAFSTVLSSVEVVTPSKEILIKSNTSSLENDTDVAITHGRLMKKICGREHGNVVKREIKDSYDDKAEILDKERGTEFESEMAKKRARIGFIGMRGKKDSSLIEKRALPPEETDLNGVNLIPKRMGFDGMAGKKDEDEYEKRGQMAFHGMRGKKDYDYEGSLHDYHFPEAAYVYDDEGWDKRAMAFHGMRGKKSETRRIPYGMLTGGYDWKRAMGFLGMRGKKTADWSSTENRGQYGFFGMKGKKAQSGFFGMRGKKSFLGDREPSDNNLNTISAESHSLSILDRDRRATNWMKNSKKAKGAFFAARGKKSSAIRSGLELDLISSSE